MMAEDPYRHAYELMASGMIEKSIGKLQESMSVDARLIHMSGKVESREEYIRDILDGTLNYYDYEILSFSKDEVLVRLLAKVYGIGKSWWTLRMKTTYVKEDGTIKIKESRVSLG